LHPIANKAKAKMLIFIFLKIARMFFNTFAK